MVGQLSLEKTFLLAAWMEVRTSISNFTCAVLNIKPILPGHSLWQVIISIEVIVDPETDSILGFLCCIFGATMYVYFSSTYSRIGSKRDRHTTVSHGAKHDYR